MTHNTRVLFVLKKRSSYGISYGLVNSATFVSRYLNEIGFDSNVVEVVDNNEIDRVVSYYRPTHVIIEALWVVPEKFRVLCKLHPKRKWVVRLHSKTPFLANEGIAIDWLSRYQQLGTELPNLSVSCNSKALVNELLKSMGLQSSYTPNIYFPDPFELDERRDTSPPGEINIGCFGAIRPMKNQLLQAMAAIDFGNQQKLKVSFHVNLTRVEQRGENVAKNLVALFKGTPHKLVGHDWMNHGDFLKLVATMDLGMQVSFSETFNIVAADFAYSQVPVVGSDEIEWLSTPYRANPVRIDDIGAKLSFAYRSAPFGVHKVNKLLLRFHNFLAGMAWKRALAS